MFKLQAYEAFVMKCNKNQVEQILAESWTHVHIFATKKSYQSLRKMINRIEYFHQLNYKTAGQTSKSWCPGDDCMSYSFTILNHFGLFGANLHNISTKTFSNSYSDQNALVDLFLKCTSESETLALHKVLSGFWWCNTSLCWQFHFQYVVTVGRMKTISHSC